MIKSDRDDLAILRDETGRNFFSFPMCNCRKNLEVQKKEDMKKIKVGVIGVGYFGKFHVEKYARSPEVELVGIMDADQPKAEALARQVQTRSFFNYSYLYSRVDAVSIAVPTRLHFQVAGDFLKNGIDVLLEKPIAASVEEAETLIELACQKNLIFQVGHLERFNPAFTFLRKSIKDPRFIESHRLSSFKDRGIDVDVILDLMIHDIDIILNLVESEIKDIHAVGIPVISPRIDIANVRLQFKNGCVANITASRISQKAMRKIRIFQNNAYLSLDLAANKVALYKKIDKPGTKDESTIVKGEVKTISGDSLEEEIKSFIESVASRKPPEVSGVEGKDALALAIDIGKQLEQGISREDID